MNDKTRDDVEELIDTIEDLGYDVESYRVSEDHIEHKSADGRIERHPVGLTLQFDLDRVEE